MAFACQLYVCMYAAAAKWKAVTLLIASNS